MAKKEETKTQNEPKVPDYIAKHKKLYSHATKLSDTASQTHTEAYANAVTKHLTVDGEVDFEKLDDPKVQELFVKTMSDLYVSRAKQHFKVAKDLDDVEKDLLMGAYVGTTQHQLKEFVNRYGKKFTHAQFDNLKGQIQRSISERLYASAGGHLEHGQVPEMIKHMGLEDKLDANKVTLEEAKELLGVFHKEGSVSDTNLREHVKSYKLKKSK